MTIENPTIGRLTLEKLRIAYAALSQPTSARQITEAELKDIRETVMLIVQALDDLSSARSSQQ